MDKIKDFKMREFERYIEEVERKESFIINCCDGGYGLLREARNLSCITTKSYLECLDEVIERKINDFEDIIKLRNNYRMR